MKKPETTYSFCVKEALLPKSGGGYYQRWYIYFNFRPVEAINRYLHRKSRKSSGTGRTYAYHLATWLNFLSFREKAYDEATRDDVDAYIDYIVHGMHCDSKILQLTEKTTYGTVAGALTAVQGFYRWFEGHVEVFDPPPGSKKAKRRARRRAKHSFKYGQIYEKPVDEFIEADDVRLRPPSFKKHWLTESERKAILDNFTTVRDKAIFMLLNEGMRIDEVLSINFSSYNNVEKTLKPSRSKGYSEGYEDKLRLIAFHHKETAKYLDQYIETERADVEAAAGDFLIPMFVNLKEHEEHKGKVVSYRNYWGILKDTVRRADMNPKEIATHVGRRTYVQEKIDEGVDEETIRQLLGWATSQLESYRNLRSKTLIKNAADKRRPDWNKDEEDKQK